MVISFQQNLGAFDSYISENNIYPDFSKAIHATGGSKTLDVTSIIELISRYHFFGNRTLVKEIKKTPWMVDSISERGEITYHDLPTHGHVIVSVEEAAKNLYTLLVEEVKKYIGNSKSVGVLLSGGMDSRMVAGILKNLQEDDKDLTVTAVTWGLKESRDAIYAEKIAESFGWDWKYFELTAELLKEAIDVTTINGAEYSPIHLHAMHKVRELPGVDLILGGSYGDSVGRAEFSGKHVLEVPKIDKYFFNWFGIMRSKAFNTYKKGIGEDVLEYRKLFPRNEEYQYREIERQCHYMRRMLNPCMSVIDQRITLRQVFTDPRTFGYMWSLDPSIRNDEIYLKLLDFLDPSLKEVPWARTGIGYLSTNTMSDKYLKLNNRYGQWIRENLYHDINKAINSDAIKSLEIFNVDTLNRLQKSSKKYYNLPRASKVDETLIWIVALQKAIERFDIKSSGASRSMVDTLRKQVVNIENNVYSKIYKKRNS